MNTAVGERLVQLDTPQQFVICNIMNFHAFHPHQVKGIEKSSCRVVMSQGSNRVEKLYARVNNKFSQKAISLNGCLF
jgi:hypothetical protein